MHNIRYWDIHTDIIKIETHDFKDEIQYSDHSLNRSLTTKNLMAIFVGSSKHTTKCVPSLFELKLKDSKNITSEDIVKNSLEFTPLPYSKAVASTLSKSINDISSVSEQKGLNLGKFSQEPRNQPSCRPRFDLK